MDKREAAQVPPLGLKVKDVPMFVSFGFDDNGNSGIVNPNNEGGVKWASELFHSKLNPVVKTPCTATFYLASHFIEGKEDGNEPTEILKKEWSNLTKLGHEVGNHTHSHTSGLEYSSDKWVEELETCNNWLKKPSPTDLNIQANPDTGVGMDAKDILGYRTPFLEFNVKTFDVVKKLGFKYDCSLEEGWQLDHDGTNYIWPYTLDGGSPGYTACHEGVELEPVEGLWEMPCYPVIIPPDDLCEKYGVKPGFRESKVGIGPDDEPYTARDGKITGLDYNMFVSFKMSKAEFLATMKYTFDLRMEGNRCPMLFGAHSDFYSPWFNLAPNVTPKEMREAVNEFLDYILSFDEVRLISNREILEWLKNPEPINKK